MSPSSIIPSLKDIKEAQNQIDWSVKYPLFPSHINYATNMSSNPIQIVNERTLVIEGLLREHSERHEKELASMQKWMFIAITICIIAFIIACSFLIIQSDEPIKEILDILKTIGISASVPFIIYKIADMIMKKIYN